MAKVLDALKKAVEFLVRQPGLENSTLLKKESQALMNVLEKYNARSEEVETSLSPNYAATAVLVEGDAKTRVTVQFIRDFARKYCSSELVVQKADKKARTALLAMAAKHGKLEVLRSQLDHRQKYRALYQRLLEQKAAEIRSTVLGMTAKDFSALVNAVGLQAPQTQKGAIATNKTAREGVLKQILRHKESDDLMTQVGRDVHDR